MDERRSGLITIWAGMLGAASGLFLAAVPPSVPEGRFSYPLAAGGFIAIQLWFAIQHIGLFIGIQALGRFDLGGTSRLTRIGRLFAGAGMLGLAFMELVVITAVDAAYPSPQTDPLDAGYGLSSVAIGVGLILVGVGVLREHRWTGWKRWVPLAGLARVKVHERVNFHAAIMPDVITTSSMARSNAAHARPRRDEERTSAGREGSRYESAGVTTRV
jgi:hypothetical protein